MYKYASAYKKNIHTYTTHAHKSNAYKYAPITTVASRVGGVDIRNISSSGDDETMSVRTLVSTVPGRATNSVPVMETVRSSTVFMVSGGSSIDTMKEHLDNAVQEPCICVCLCVCVCARAFG